MLDDRLKASYTNWVLAPFLKLRWVQKQPPWAFTLIGLVCGISIPFFLSFGYSYLTLTVLILSGLFDTLDGALARSKNISSPKGAVLDITCDRAVEFSIILALFLVDPIERGLLCLFMLGSILLCITSFLVVGIFSHNKTEKSFYYSPGIIERFEAFIFFSLMILCPSLFSFMSLLFTGLVLLTTVIRLKQFFTNSS